MSIVGSIKIAAVSCALACLAFASGALAQTPAPAVIKSASHVFTASNDSISGNISADIQILSDGLSEANLLSTSAQIMEFSVPEGVHLLKVGDMVKLLAEKKGSFTVSLTLAIPVEKHEELSRAKLPVVRAAISSLRLTVPGDDMLFRVRNADTFTVTKTAGATSMSLRPGIAASLLVSWFPESLKAKFDPEFSATTRSSVSFSRGLAWFNDSIDFIFPAEGKTDAVVRLKHAERRVTTVEAKDLSSWSIDKEDDGLVIKLKFQKAISGPWFLAFQSELLVPKDFDIELGPPLVEGAVKQRGLLAVFADDGISVAESAAAFVERPAAKTPPPPGGKAPAPVGKPPALLYECPDQRAAVTVSVTEKKPSIQGRLDMLSFIPYEGLNELYCGVVFSVNEFPVTSFTLSFPKECVVTEAGGQGLARWETKDGTLKLFLESPVIGSAEYFFYIDMPYMTGTSWPMPEISCPEALNWEGLLGVGSADDLEVACAPTNDLTRININELPAWIQSTAPAFAYKFTGKKYGLACSVSERISKVSAYLECAAVIMPDASAFVTNIQLNIEKRGLFRIDAVMPEGLTATSVATDGLKDWSFDPATSVLRVEFTEAMFGKITLIAVFESSEASASGTIILAPPRILQCNATYEAHLVFAPSEDVKLASLPESKGFEASIKDLPPQLKSSYPNATHAFKFNSLDGKAMLYKESVATQMTVEAVNDVFPRKGFFTVVSELNYRISAGRVNRFRVRLPEGAVNSEIRGQYIKDRTFLNDVWTVELETKVKGDYQLAVRYETNIPDAEGRFMAGLPAPLDVAGFTGFATVWKTSQGDEITVLDKGSAIETDSTAVPRRLPAPTSATPVFAYSFGTAEAALRMQIAEHSRKEMLEAQIISCEIKTIVRDDGETVTILNAETVNTTKQSIFVKLPEGSFLCGAYIDSNPVKPVSAEGGFKIPVLARRTDGDKSFFELGLIWSGSVNGSLGGNLNLVPPEFDVEVNDLKWGVYLPEGYNVASCSDEMSLFYRDPNALVPSLVTEAKYSLLTFVDAIRSLFPGWLPIAAFYALLTIVAAFGLIIVVRVFGFLLALLDEHLGRKWSRRLVYGTASAGLLVIIVAALMPALLKSKMSYNESPVAYYKSVSSGWGGGGGGGDDTDGQMQPVTLSFSAPDATEEELEMTSDAIFADAPSDAQYEKSPIQNKRITEKDYAYDAKDLKMYGDKEITGMSVSESISQSLGDLASNVAQDKDKEVEYDTDARQKQAELKKEFRAAKNKKSEEEGKRRDMADQLAANGPNSNKWGNLPSRPASSPPPPSQPAKPSDGVFNINEPINRLSEFPPPEITLSAPEDPTSEDWAGAAIHAEAGSDITLGEKTSLLTAAEGDGISFSTYTLGNMKDPSVGFGFAYINADEFQMPNLSQAFAAGQQGRSKGVLPIRLDIPMSNMRLFAFELPYFGAGMRKFDILVFGTGWMLAIQALICIAIGIVTFVLFMRHGVMGGVFAALVCGAALVLRWVTGPMTTSYLETAGAFSAALFLAYAIIWTFEYFGRRPGHEDH